jgi:hypothetical protein
MDKWVRIYICLGLRSGLPTCRSASPVNDDQRCARTNAAHNLAVLKHITLNLIRLYPIKRRGGINARRLIATISDRY